MSDPATEAPRGRAWLWPLSTAAATILFAGIRLIGAPGFYFADDSQLGSLGMWWKLGDELAHGVIPTLDPSAWQAGNYWAEGQWGLLNPLTWLVALLTRAVDDPVISMTIIKIGFLTVMALGVYALARSFGAAPPWAALAGVLAPLGGFTIYMDAPSWATGLFNAALLPWTWWALRRAVEARRSPLAYLVASYLLITFGYVFGVLVLVVILVECLVRAIIRKDRSAIVGALLASAWGALLTIVVYLPGVLTAPVTERAGFSVFNVGFLNADLTDLGSAASPTATGSIGAWWGFATDAPLPYIAWAIPLFGLFLPMSRGLVRRSIPLFVLGAVMLAVVIGPSHIGPLRWPIRLIPYLVICVVVLLAVAATEAYPERITRRRVAVALGILVVMTYLAFANVPSGWRSLALVAAIQTAAILSMWWLAAGRRLLGWSRTRRIASAVVAAVVVSGLLIPLQMRLFPTTPLPVNAVPRSVSAMSDTLAGTDGDAIMVGDVFAGARNEATYRERLIANLWYLSPTPVGSLYTVLPFSTFSDDLCTDLRGSTCPEALDTLFERDSDTGERVVDLMGLSAVVAMKKTFPDEPRGVPAGWTVRSGGDFTWLIERDEEVPGAGTVTATGSGTRVSDVTSTDTSVTFRVDAVGDDPRVVLSRLAYPGYGVDGAALTDPVRGWLLTVDVSDAEEGATVTVTFRPPGYVIEVAAAVLAILVLGAWIVWDVRRRRSRAEPAPAETPST